MKKESRIGYRATKLENESQFLNSLMAVNKTIIFTLTVFLAVNKMSILSFISKSWLLKYNFWNDFYKSMKIDKAVCNRNYSM